MNILEKLFGSAARVKLLRLFLLSPEKIFTFKEAAKLLRISNSSASREARALVSAGFLKNVSRVDEILRRIGKKQKTVKSRTKGFQLIQTFPYLLPLRHLLVTASPVSRERMLKFFKNHGKVKLLVLSGVFAADFSQDISQSVERLDLLVVGELKRAPVERFARKLESEVGKELIWTLMNGAEFDHRLAMHDRLLRDLLDYPHEFLINKLGLE